MTCVCVRRIKSPIIKTEFHEMKRDENTIKTAVREKKIIEIPFNRKNKC